MRAALLLLGLGGCTLSGEVVLSPGPTVEVVPQELPRERRRMNVDQLKASMEAVSGGIGWTEEQDGQTVDLFQALAVTLGKPDYLSTTTEDLGPGLLFQKFLDDASKSVCTELLAAEQARSGSERVLLVDSDLDDEPGSEAVESDLRRALVRFHGRSLSAGSPELEPWSQLFEDAVLVSDTEQAWTLVCVALFTHPDFYSY